MQNLGKNLETKLKFWAFINSVVENLQLSVRIPSEIATICSAYFLTHDAATRK